MPFVVHSSGPTGSDTVGAPQKTIRVPAPTSGPPRSRTTKGASGPPKPVLGSLSYPIVPAVTADRRPRCLGCGRTPGHWA